MKKTYTSNSFGYSMDTNGNRTEYCILNVYHDGLFQVGARYYGDSGASYRVSSIIKYAGYTQQFGAVPLSDIKISPRYGKQCCITETQAIKLVTDFLSEQGTSAE